MNTSAKSASLSSWSLPKNQLKGFAGRWINASRLAAFLVSLITLIPLLVVLSSLLASDAQQSEIWSHLSTLVLPEILRNTLWLTLGVALGAAVLGVSLAWLTAVCEFPGSRFFAWSLMLPLAMPAYVTAFVAIGLLDFTGPLQTMLREAFGSSTWFPKIRSRNGVIFVMVLAFYPYVYLLARNAFLTQGKRALEAGQSLAMNRRAGFFKIALPMAWPWIAAGIMLVVMETLADFGTVSVFNFDTFTTAIYKAWFGLFSLPTASQLASVLVLIVFAVVAIEQRIRGNRRFNTQAAAKSAKYQLKPLLKWSAFTYAAAVLCIAFVIPFIQLLVWSAQVFADDFDSRYPQFVWHSSLLSAMAALAVVCAGLVLSYALRIYRDWPTRFFIRLSTLGYAIPGSVLAVGIFIPIAWLDNQLIKWLHAWTGASGGAILRGTLAVMLLAYVARFLAPGFNAIDSAMQRITKSQEDAARSLGITGWRMLLTVHVPLLRGGLLTAAMLVFVDVMKEMPITLMTRPFGWDTLAVRIFEMTSEGQWERAALPAVAVVIVGLLPVALLTRESEA